MTTHIVVAGGGYAGLGAARLARKWTDAKVTLVNASDRFVERVRLHQLAAGQTLRDWPITELLTGSGVDLVVDRITGIDPSSRRIELAGGADLHYDRLVYALGSEADPGSVPGVAEHAYTLAGHEQAVRLRDRLAHSASVAVTGGGLTGIEAAAELAESRPGLTVHLVTSGKLGAALSERGAAHLCRTFTRLGVRVHEDAMVTEVGPDGLRLREDSPILVDTVVWTAGFRVPYLAKEAGFAVDERGRMLVDDTLRSVSHPDVTGVGDAAAITTTNGLHLRMACATGVPSAQQGVRALAARLAGKEPAGMKFRYLNQCISLGRRNGLIQFVRADDTPRNAVLTGRIAARYKETVVRGVMWWERHPAVPASV